MVKEKEEEERGGRHCVGPNSQFPALSLFLKASKQDNRS